MDRFLGRVRQDLRYSVRCRHTDRRFTLLAVLALALGIGSATIILSAVYGVILNTFDHDNPDTIVSIAIHGVAKSGDEGREGLSSSWTTASETMTSKP